MSERLSFPSSALIDRTRGIRDDVQSPQYLQDMRGNLIDNGVTKFVDEDTLDDYVEQLRRTEAAAIRGVLQLYVRELAASDPSTARELLNGLRQELEGSSELSDREIDTRPLRGQSGAGGGLGEVHLAKSQVSQDGDSPALSDGFQDLANLLQVLIAEVRAVRSVVVERDGHTGRDKKLDAPLRVIGCDHDEVVGLTKQRLRQQARLRESSVGECYPSVSVGESSHDASPSTGEGAEPGLASNLSVEGERAAGGPIPGTPAAISPAQPDDPRIPTWSLADRFRKAREITGMEQGEFADHVGVSRGTVSNAERGRRPHASNIRRWARVSGVPVIWLMTGQTTTPSEDEEDAS